MEDKFLQIKKILQEMIDTMDLSGEVSVDATDPQLVRFSIQSEEASYLIGRGGENLKAFQEIARAIVNKRFAQRIPFIVDVNDYQETRLSLLKEMAKKLAQEVFEKGEPRWLPPMNAYERRVIHLALKDFNGVKTESEGENEERRVVIKPEI